MKKVYGRSRAVVMDGCGCLTGSRVWWMHGPAAEDKYSR